jgi:malonate-semialdehyde dehydrogenase (acetylating)/methylmalonate-semialdehyde dehydrogenase
MTKIVNHWIGGKTVDGASGIYGPVTDPATGAVTTKVAFASVDEVDAAVQAAREAFVTWGQSSLAQRTSILFAFRALLDANRDAIAELITAEHGKVHSDALGEVARGLEIVDLACGINVQLKGRSRAVWTWPRSASRSAWSPASRRSTSRRWSRCGCSRWPSRAATPSC